MPIDITLPALSPTMESGTLAKWLVSPGDTIAAGDLLAEIETDKATMEFEATEDGVGAELKVTAGTEDIPVGTVIATMAQEGSAVLSSNDDRKWAGAHPSAPQPAGMYDAARRMPVDRRADAKELASRLALEWPSKRPQRMLTRHTPSTTAPR